MVGALEAAAGGGWGVQAAEHCEHAVGVRDDGGEAGDGGGGGAGGRLRAVAGDCTPQNISNTLWAYATMGERPGRVGVFGALEGRLRAVAKGFDRRHIANTLWAYATMGERPGRGWWGAGGAAAGGGGGVQPAGDCEHAVGIWEDGGEGRGGVVGALRGGCGRARRVLTRTHFEHAVGVRDDGGEAGAGWWGRWRGGCGGGGESKPQEIANTLWAYATMGEGGRGRGWWGR